MTANLSLQTFVVDVHRRVIFAQAHVDQFNNQAKGNG